MKKVDLSSCVRWLGVAEAQPEPEGSSQECVCRSTITVLPTEGMLYSLTLRFDRRVAVYTSLERFCLSHVYDQPDPFGEREFTEKK